ncbi:MULTISPECIES: terminase small subunit-like protein [unclassified Sphingomonas]|uniref:terminase small subunit-like protein n=1 Tax=Sphingomonas sp. PvP015 TaxID=3156388 RepID=UPI0033972865
MKKSKQTHTRTLPCVAQQQALANPVAEAIKVATRARPGQPTVRTPAVIEEILDRIACGEALHAICQDDHLPGYSTFNRWCREDRDLLGEVDIAYEFHARTMDDMADSILAGGPGSTGEFRRDEARVGHLRYRLGKLNRRFRDKSQVDVVSHQVFVLPNDAIEGEGY